MLGNCLNAQAVSSILASVGGTFTAETTCGVTPQEMSAEPLPPKDEKPPKVEDPAGPPKVKEEKPPKVEDPAVKDSADQEPKQEDTPHGYTAK